MREDLEEELTALVYIDESGDAGFRVEQGSSPVFVAAMVIFEDADDAPFDRRLGRLPLSRRERGDTLRSSSEPPRGER